MDPWKRDFAVLGQEMIEFLENNPHKGPDAVVRLREQLGQIKRRPRHKNSDGITTSHQRKKDEMSTVTLQTPSGDDVQVSAAAFRAAMKEQGIKYKVREDSDDEDEDEDEIKLSKSMRKQIARNVAIEARTTYAWDLQSVRISYSWMELAGKAIIIGAVLMAGIWVASKIWRGPADGLMPDDVTP